MSSHNSKMAIAQAIGGITGYIYSGRTGIYMEEKLTEEEKATRRKLLVNAEARDRIAAKKIEIEKAKFEEEVLAEIARLEALM